MSGITTKGVGAKYNTVTKHNADGVRAPDKRVDALGLDVVQPQDGVLDLLLCCPHVGDEHLRQQQQALHSQRCFCNRCQMPRCLGRSVLRPTKYM